MFPYNYIYANYVLEPEVWSESDLTFYQEYSFKSSSTFYLLKDHQ